MRKLNAQRGRHKMSVEVELDIKKEIGKQLKRLRGEKNQQVVADALLVKQSVISKYENGEHLVDLFTLAEFASYYKVPFIDLLPQRLIEIETKNLSINKRRTW